MVAGHEFNLKSAHVALTQVAKTLTDSLHVSWSHRRSRGVGHTHTVREQYKRMNYFYCLNASYYRFKKQKMQWNVNALSTLCVTSACCAYSCSLSVDGSSSTKSSSLTVTKFLSVSEKEKERKKRKKRKNVVLPFQMGGFVGGSYDGSFLGGARRVSGRRDGIILIGGGGGGGSRSGVTPLPLLIFGLFFRRRRRRRRRRLLSRGDGGNDAIQRIDTDVLVWRLTTVLLLISCCCTAAVVVNGDQDISSSHHIVWQE